jgi:hypothetical protein
VDSLCSNLSVLASSCGMLDASADTGALVAHRSALKAYVFFLTHLVLAAEAEAKTAEPVAAPKARRARRRALLANPSKRASSLPLHRLARRAARAPAAARAHSRARDTHATPLPLARAR